MEFNYTITSGSLGNQVFFTHDLKSPYKRNSRIGSNIHEPIRLYKRCSIAENIKSTEQYRLKYKNLQFFIKEARSAYPSKKFLQFILLNLAEKMSL
jgi:hypothetical protein